MATVRERQLDRQRLYEALRSMVRNDVEIWLVAGGFVLKDKNGNKNVSTRVARKITGVPAPQPARRKRPDLAASLLASLKRA